MEKFYEEEEMYTERTARKRVIELLSRFEQREIVEIATHLFANRKATSIEDAVQKARELCETVSENSEAVSLYRKSGSSAWFVFFTKRDGTCFDNDMMLLWGARLSSRKDACIMAVSAKVDVPNLRKRVHDFVVSEPLGNSANILPFERKRAKIFR